MVEEFTTEILTSEKHVIEPIFMKCKELYERRKKPIILFGAGLTGLAYKVLLKKYTLGDSILFCDNNPDKWGTVFDGIPVISFEELKTKYHDSYIFITSYQFGDEIFEQLQEHQMLDMLVDETAHRIKVSNYIDYFDLIRKNSNMFKTIYQLFADDESRKIFVDRMNYSLTSRPQYLLPLRSHGDQYFEPEIISLSKDEIFVDGGAYTGDTVEKFLNHSKGRFKKIIAFEPEKQKHEIFLRKFSAHKNIELVPYGLWDRTEVLRFQSDNNLSSHLSESGNITVPVTSIDEKLKDEPVTFIKFDIEGAELKALQGAAQTIRKYKPKLAICVYHKPMDIVEIPLYINQLVPEYKIYLRHYSDDLYETVCYAVTDT